jgi:hypothetical protein
MLKWFSNLIRRPAEGPAGKESDMAEEAKDNATVTPPATSGGITKEQLDAAIAGALGTVNKAIESLTANQKILSDTIAGQKVLSAEDVQTLIGKGLKEGLSAEVEKTLKAKGEADAAAAAKKALRDKVIGEKLKGVPASLINLPDSDDEKVLGEAADKLAAELNAFAKPADQGGAAKDGGKTPGETQTAAKTIGGMTDGAAAYAASLKQPA